MGVTIQNMMSGGYDFNGNCYFTAADIIEEYLRLNEAPRRLRQAEKPRTPN